MRAPHPVYAVPVIAAFRAAFSVEVLRVPETAAFAFLEAAGMVPVNGGGVIASVAMDVRSAGDFGKDAVWSSLFHQAYKSLSENHIIPFLGSIPLRQLRAPAIQKFYNQLRAKGLSPKYIKNIHGCLHRALDMAIKVEYIEKNYSSFCSLPRGGEQEINPLDKPEQKRLFDALKGHEYEALIITAIFTGMRCGELIGLTWDCIDFDNGTIYIKRQLTQARVAGAPFEFGSLKNGKTRTIMPAPFVMKTLAAHKEDQEKKKKAAGDLWDEGECPGLVFTHADGSHLSQPTVWKQFQKILKAAGLEHHRVHDLRHTFAVNSIMAGDDIKTLQENMGHYSAAFTLDRYGHVTATMRQASANRMQAFIDAM